MMVRPFKERRIEQLPPITGYKPSGVPLRDIDEIVLTFEEMEALRLVDAEQLDMAEAADKMAVSKPTMCRIIGKSRQKVALALWQGKFLRVEGGTFRLERSAPNRLRHFVCVPCGYRWDVPYDTGRRGREFNCPQCHSAKIYREE